MPVVDDSIRPQQTTTSAQTVLEKFRAAIKEFDQSQQHADFLSDLEAGFRRFARLQEAEIRGQRSLIAADQHSAIQGQLDSSIEIYDQTRVDQLSSITRYQTTVERSQERFAKSYQEFVQSIENATPKDRQVILESMSQHLAEQGVEQKYIVRLKAQLSKSLPPALDQLDIAYEHFSAWRTLSTEARDLELRQKSAAGSYNTLSQRNRLRAVSKLAREIIQTLPEKTQREYLLLSRQRFEKSKNPVAGDSIFDNNSSWSKTFSVDSRLDQIIPDFSNTVFSDSQPDVPNAAVSLGADTELKFEQFISRLHEKMQSLEFDEITKDTNRLGDLKESLGQRQQQIVDTFLEGLAPRQKRRVLAEAQQRLRSKPVDSLRVHNRERPIESRFADLFPGVEIVYPKPDPFAGLAGFDQNIGEEKEASSQLPPRLARMFNEMTAELSKLHQLETIVIAAADTTERDRVQVYRRAADEILANMPRIGATDLAVQMTASGLERLKITHIDPLFGSDTKSVEQEISAFVDFYKASKAENFQISDADVFIEQGRAHDSISRSIAIARQAVPNALELGELLAQASSFPEEAGSRLADTVSKVFSAGSSETEKIVENELKELVLPKISPVAQLISSEALESSPEIIKLLPDILEEFDSGPEPEQLAEFLYDVSKQLQQAKREIEYRNDSFVVTEISKSISCAPEELSREEIVRDLRSLAEAQFILSTDSELPTRVAGYSQLVLDEIASPDHKLFGANYSRLSDLLDEVDQSDPDFDLEEFVDCQLAAIPEYTREVFAKNKDRYLASVQIDLESARRSYHEHSKAELRSDIEKLLRAANTVFASSKSN